MDSWEIPWQLGPLWDRLGTLCFHCHKGFNPWLENQDPTRRPQTKTRQTTQKYQQWMKRLRNSVDLVPRFRRRKEEISLLSYKHALGSCLLGGRSGIEMKDLSSDGELYGEEKCLSGKKSTCNLQGKWYLEMK